MARCLYNSDFATFLYTDSASIYRILDDNYHGEALTTTRDAWKAEIEIMKNVVESLCDADGQIILNMTYLDLAKELTLFSFIAESYSALNLKLASRRFLNQILTKFWTMLWI